MIRKTNIFRSIFMRRRRKMSFLFRHLIHRELYASCSSDGEKNVTNHIAKQPARKPTKEEAGDELTELLRAGAACWAWGSGVLVLRAFTLQCVSTTYLVFPPCNHMDV
jgi:hypothetical protein